ncbi:hypothetical protein JR334_10955 [Clostridia bacterium]|nr:hypothetical protein JR334_10955 [Clostridia bacterium]
METNRKTTYAISIHSALGPKKGILCLDIQEHDLSGKLSILGFTTTFSGGKASHNNYIFPCTLKTATGIIAGNIHLLEEEGTLHGMAETAKGCLAITGKRCDS